MPVVPRYGDQRVDASPLPDTRLNASGSNAFGLSPSIGQAAQNALGRAENWADAEVKKANQLQVLDADRQLSALETNIQYDPKSGIINRKGKDAFSLPDDVRTMWDKGVSEIEKSLKNDVQKESFRAMQIQRWTDLDRNVQRHVSGERKAYDEQVTSSYIDNEQGAAALNYLDPERVRMSIDRQRAAIIDHADRNGLPEEALVQRINDAVSKTHTAVMARMLANDQDMAAQKYMQDHKDELTAEDITRVEKAVEEGSLRGESQRRVDDIMGRGLSRSDAMEEARSVADPKLRDAVEERVSRAYEQRRAAERQDQEDLYQRAANLIDSGPRGAPARSVIPPDQWSRLTPEQRSALQRRAEDPDNNDKVWLDFLSLSPTDVAGLSRAEFETSYWSHFDKERRTRAESFWSAAVGGKGSKDPAFAATLTFKDRVDNTLRTTGLLDPNKSKSKFNEDEATLYSRFENEAARAIQEYEVNVLGGKRKATGEEMQKVLDTMAVQRVFIDKPWGRDPELPARLVQPDDRGRAYVPYDKIPADALVAMKSEAERLKIKPTRDALEKAYGALLSGERDDDRIRAILRSN